MTGQITESLLAAGAALADVLARENAALDALDLAGAAALYAEKAATAATFTTAQRHAGETTDPGPDAETREAAQHLAERLRDLADANKRLLERGIFVQGRVLATIARALARGAPAAQTPRYARNGGLAQAERQQAVMLSARA